MQCEVLHPKPEMEVPSNGTSLCSNNSSDTDSTKDIEAVILRRSPCRNITNGNGDENGEDTASIDSARRREEEMFRRRSSSMLEVKEHAHARLRDELQKAQDELKLKDEECKKLAHVQEQMGQELEELTASLFEEANKMVQDANVKRMQSEKLLKEAKSKVEILQAEVVALKSLVITSTPSMPNRHLHPQLDGPEPTHASKITFTKGHRRSTSHHNFVKDKLSFSRSPQADPEFLPQSPVQPVIKQEEREMDPIFFELFKSWQAHPSLDQTCLFIGHIFKEDIQPCFSFNNSQLSQAVLQSVLGNTLIIEPVAEKSPFPKRCQLTDCQRLCKHRLKLGESAEAHLISQLARNRVAAVCDFYTYVRYICQGLVKCDVTDMYWEIVKLRKQMCLAKLGLS